MLKSWKSFKCSTSELNLNIVLACGQSFRWSKNLENEWTGVIGKKVWKLKQEDSIILYKSFQQVEEQSDLKPSCLNIECGINSDESLLKDYFQLDISLRDLYENWGKIDKNFQKLAHRFDGVRMLRQDPVENLFSFICSQNNHITRISSMVEKLCRNYGEFICFMDDKEHFSFPSLSSLASEDVELKLRELGFGYRAKFIHKCATQILTDESEKWLYELRNISYKEAHQALCKLPGVGAKVADCVCLMSLDKTEAIPVDTHMWQIAKRDYLPHLQKYKTLTDKIYQEIGDHFREIYGQYAGWAHSVLFSADLKRFQDLKQKAITSSKIHHPPPDEQKQDTKAKRQEDENAKISEAQSKLESAITRSITKDTHLVEKVLKRKSPRLAANEVNVKLQKI